MKTLIVTTIFLSVLIISAALFTRSQSMQTPPIPSLQNTLWQLTSLQAENGTLVTPPTIITIQFDIDRMSGSGGCNNYFATYSLSGNSLSLGEIGSTTIACEETVMQTETHYFNLLQKTTTLSVTNDTLTLYDESNQPLLTFQAQPPISLETTPWEAQGINNGRGGVETTATTPHSTAMFEAGTISGNAGCNRYNGSYQLEADTLTIGPLATTRMWCENLMDQEQQFLSALEATNRYELTSTTLTLRQNDTTMIVFTTNK